ncbi:DUF192 domain-containing protein [Brackiella oedipodis]|uniref:DUF192 domain-containing protein n=1 Tax=Brackiella oedipodis TaxID=124225 RepID=UPI000AD8103E
MSDNYEIVFCDSFYKRLKGLIAYRSLAPGRFFLIDRCNCIHTFGMRFAIDALFFDKKGRFLRYVHQLQPWYYYHCRNAFYVLELYTSKRLNPQQIGSIVAFCRQYGFRPNNN